MSNEVGDHRITHIGVCVSDLERSVAFYVNALGFTERSRLPASGPTSARLLSLPELDLEMVYLERSGIRIELLWYRRPSHEGNGVPRSMNLLGLTHVALRVDDLAILCQRIPAWGGAVLEETLVDFPHGNRGIMTLDPDGLRLELIERVPSSEALLGGAPGEQAMSPR